MLRDRVDFRELLRVHLPYLIALAGVALVTASLLIFRQGEGTHLANVPMLYLMAVLGVASAFGSGPAILTAMTSFLVIMWLFVELPLDDPEDVLILVLFLVAAVIAGQLAAGQRRQAAEARQREREANLLYDVVRLMSAQDLDRALHAIADRLCRASSLAAVEIAVADGPMVSAAATSGDYLALIETPRSAVDPTLGPPGPPQNAQEDSARHRDEMPGHPANAIHAYNIMADGRAVGCIRLLLAGKLALHPVEHRLLSTVADQVGMLVARIRLQREATENEIFKRTDELKTALLNAVSHDLRTPLSSIIASSGSLLQEEVHWTKKERREYAEAIRDEADRLNRIVENLLDLSRIESGNLSPNKSWYDLRTLIDEVSARLRALIAHHHLVVDVPEELPPVYLDHLAIDQVLSNLIENATKYAQAGTEIQLSARVLAGEVLIAIADRGPGVPDHALSNLFASFYRIAGREPRPDGIGLGLAVARGLVEAHGGRIWAENRAGGGARFIFSLPLNPEA